MTAFEQYAQGVATSSKRARAVLFVVMTASVVIFAAFWNSRQCSWTMQRLKVVRSARMYWDKESAPAGVDPELFRKGAEYLKLTQFPDKKSDQVTLHLAKLDRDIQALEKAFYEDILLVKVPFFGVVFDVNDLGLIGGLALTILLLMFRYCLATELVNLQIAFDSSWKAEKRKETYEILRMNQVLTLTPGAPGSGMFWLVLPKLLYLLPVIVILFIAIHDISTIERGMTFSFWGTLISVIASWVFAVVLIIITWSCFSLSSQLTGEWRKRHADI